jgi:hypothetical protein
MFWLIIVSPLVVLSIAAAFGRRGPLFRLVLLLLAVCLVINVSLFVYLVFSVGKSTDPVALAVVALIELLVAVIALAVVLFSRARVRNNRHELPRSNEFTRRPDLE